MRRADLPARALPAIAFALVVFAVLARATFAADPEEDPSYAAAREAFEDGVRLLDEGRPDAASVAFERSVAARPSLSAFYNLGLAYQKLGKLKLALGALARHQELAAHEGANEDTQLAEKLLVDVKSALVSVTLEVAGNPDVVLVDGEAIALKNGDILLLDPGSRAFEAQRKGYEPDAKLLVLSPGATVRVELDAAKKPLPGSLVVNTKAPLAEIRVDGLIAGHGTSSRKVAPGMYSIEVVEPDYEPWARRVEVRPGAETTVDVELVERPPEVWEQWWFWAGVAALAAGGVAGGVWIATRGGPSPTGGELGVSVPALSP